MYSIVKIVHSYWTFLTLIIIALVVLNAIHGKVYGKIFRVNDLRISLFGIIFSHVPHPIGDFKEVLFEGYAPHGIAVIQH